MKLTKEQAQKNLFKSLCQIYDKNRRDSTLQMRRNGITYTCIELMINDGAIEEIRSWIEDEDI